MIEFNEEVKKPIDEVTITITTCGKSINPLEEVNQEYFILNQTKLNEEL